MKLETIVGWAIGLIVLLAIVAVTISAIEERRRWRQCTDNHGQWIKFNCHNVEDYVCSPEGENVLCHFETNEQCSTRCDGATAEEAQ